MPTRWVIRGFSGLVDDIDGCAFTEMQLVGHREGIKIPNTSNREEAIEVLKEAGLIWEEETPEEVLRKNEEIRKHFLGG